MKYHPAYREGANGDRPARHARAVRRAGTVFDGGRGMTKLELTAELERLAGDWAAEVKFFRKNDFGTEANVVQVCVNDLRALVRRAKREGAA